MSFVCRMNRELSRTFCSNTRNGKMFELEGLEGPLAPAPDNSSPFALYTYIEKYLHNLTE